jgi:hypothetical protein
MSDPQQPEKPVEVSGSSPDQSPTQDKTDKTSGNAEQAEGQTQPSEVRQTPGEVRQALPGEVRPAEAAVLSTQDAPTAGHQGSTKSRLDSKKPLILGLGAAAVVVVLVLAAFVWPGILAGPGKPDATAAEAAAALASKDPGRLDKVSCHGPDGKPTAQAFPPQALQLIQSARPAGPPRLTLDTQAVVPVDLTLGAEGRTQNLPADVVLGVTHGKWCMNGISQRQ